MPRSAIARFSSGTPVSRTRFFIACSNSDGVGSAFDAEADHRAYITCQIIRVLFSDIAGEGDISCVSNWCRMTSGGTDTGIEDIRRRYKLMALMGLSGDLVVIAVFWLLDVLPQDLLLIITALLVASGTTMSYLFVKVLPGRIAKAKGNA